MKKIIIGLCVIVVVAVFGGRALYLHEQSVREKDVVKIGALLPMSGGSVDFIGPWSFDSLKIAEEAINSSGLYDFKIKVVLQDGKSTPKATVDAFNKLVAEKVNAVLILGDTPTYSIAQFTKDAKMPTLAEAGMENLYDLSNYFFRLTIRNTDMMPDLAKYATQDMGIKNIAVLHVKVPLAVDTTKEFIRVATENGAKITATESFSENATEARVQVLKLLDTKPDALFIFGWNTAYVDAINYTRQMGFKGPIFTDMNIGTAIQAVKEKQNIFYVSPTFIDKMDKYGYVKKFKEKHNGNEPNVFNTFAYIGVLLMSDVMASTENPTSDMIMQKLKSIQTMETPLGLLQFKQNGDVVVPFIIKEIMSDGTVKIVKE